MHRPCVILVAALAMATLFLGPPGTATADATITFMDSGQALGQGVSFCPALGDIDGDGDLDLFIANYWTACKVWKNNGGGTFTNTGQNFGVTSGHGVDMGDLDGDTDPDAFLVFNQAADWVLLNDGTGTFTDTGQRLGGADENGCDVYLADVDGDHDLDAAVYNYLHPNRIWINDGGAHFTAVQALGDSLSGPMGLGDLDADGDIDIFMMRNEATSTVWLNDGTGTFTDTGQSLGYADGWGHLELGDLDGDHDLDAFVTNSIHGNTVWLNDGAANFTAGPACPGDGTEKLDLGDIEGDGDLDAFTTNHTLTNGIWLNDGLANFAHIDSLFGIQAIAVKAGDVDRDGDLDVVVSRLQGYGPTGVYFNTTPSAQVDRGMIDPSGPLLSRTGPNPFGLGAEVSYRVPSPGHVSLRVFDVRGREIRTLVNGFHAAGSYSVSLDGCDLAAGAYLCRLEIQDGQGRRAVETRKMLRVR
ncbi:MAG: T9SS type A sorting domain-containing protein [bacterium]